MNEPEWIAVSRSFLAFLEADGEGSPEELEALLDRLLRSAEPLSLPDTEQEAPERDALEVYKHWYVLAQRRLSSLADLGSEDGRWILDDLADIATELDRTLNVWDAELPEAAQWEFRFGFEEHWGRQHARPLLRYLQDVA